MSFLPWHVLRRFPPGYSCNTPRMSQVNETKGDIGTHCLSYGVLSHGLSREHNCNNLMPCFKIVSIVFQQKT
jgi:hypothetical protein